MVLVFTFSLLFCVRWLQGWLQRRANDYLGFFGERYVAEWLDPLKAHGWFITHDVPCHGATGTFNLDHVAVGPGGIWVLETKTRRKGRARPGFKDHEVTFDGFQIIWPWSEDTDSLKQASSSARWLRDWLMNATGKGFDVRAVLVFPGYWVTERKLGPCDSPIPRCFRRFSQAGVKTCWPRKMWNSSAASLRRYAATWSFEFERGMTPENLECFFRTA